MVSQSIWWRYYTWKRFYWIKNFLNWLIYLQFDGRFEGFEHYVESLFGPGGPYQQKEIGYLLEGLRPKRKATPSTLNSGKLSTMDKQFDAGSHFSNEPEVCGTQILLKDDNLFRYTKLIFSS